MSGSAHQRKVVETAVANALKKSVDGEPTSSSLSVPRQDDAILGRSSIEAYVFFIVAAVYVVMSAFGIPVNFWAGLGMSLFMALAAVHLLWSSVWTHNWNKLAKVAGTAIVVFILLLVVNQGYVHTHKKGNPSAETLSAIQNLTGLIGALQKSGDNPQIQNTQIFEVDGRYPEIQLGEPRLVPDGFGHDIINIDEKNGGNGTARNTFGTVGLFIAPLGREHENKIFRYLYEHVKDPSSQIPHSDIPPGGSDIVPIGRSLKDEGGNDATDAERMALYNQTSVLYTAVLVTYQDTRGHVYHKELCYFAPNASDLIRKCTAHNGNG